MYCPRCRSEYRPEHQRCVECDVELVAELAPGPPVGEQAMVSVLQSGDAALLPLLKSVLDAAEIPYIVQGDEAAGLFPLPGGAPMFSRAAFAATLLVPRDRADEALELIASIRESDPPPAFEANE